MEGKGLRLITVWERFVRVKEFEEEGIGKEVVIVVIQEEVVGCLG